MCNSSSTGRNWAPDPNPCPIENPDIFGARACETEIGRAGSGSKIRIRVPDQNSKFYSALKQ